MEHKFFPIFKTTGNLNYWDCISQRMREKHAMDILNQKDWVERASDYIWEMHGKLCQHANCISKMEN